RLLSGGAAGAPGSAERIGGASRAGLRGAPSETMTGGSTKSVRWLSRPTNETLSGSVSRKSVNEKTSEARIGRIVNARKPITQGDRKTQPQTRCSRSRGEGLPLPSAVRALMGVLPPGRRPAGRGGRPAGAQARRLAGLVEEDLEVGDEPVDLGVDVEPRLAVEERLELVEAVVGPVVVGHRRLVAR